MVRFCAVPTCKVRRVKGNISIHRFPTSLAPLNIWLKRFGIRRDDKDASCFKNWRVCGKHFAPCNKTTTHRGVQLYKGSLPTLSLPYLGNMSISKQNCFVAGYSEPEDSKQIGHNENSGNSTATTVGDDLEDSADSADDQETLLITSDLTHKLCDANLERRISTTKQSQRAASSRDDLPKPVRSHTEQHGVCKSRSAAHKKSLDADDSSTGNGVANTFPVQKSGAQRSREFRARQKALNSKLSRDSSFVDPAISSANKNITAGTVDQLNANNNLYSDNEVSNGNETTPRTFKCDVDQSNDYIDLDMDIDVADGNLDPVSHIFNGNPFKAEPVDSMYNSGSMKRSSSSSSLHLDTIKLQSEQLQEQQEPQYVLACSLDLLKSEPYP